MLSSSATPFGLTRVASVQGLWLGPGEAVGICVPVETSIGPCSAVVDAGSVWPAAALPKEASSDAGLEHSA